MPGSNPCPVALKVIEEPMRRTLEALRKKCVTAIVGGSDFVKIEEQMAGKGLNPKNKK